MSIRVHPWLNFGLWLLPLTWLWFRLIKHLSVEWSLNEQYSYGWAVPFLCAYLAWKRAGTTRPRDNGTTDNGRQKAESRKRKVDCETTGQGRVTAGDGDHLTPALPVNQPTPSPSQEGSRMAGARLQFPSWEGLGVGSGEQFASLGSSLILSPGWRGSRYLPSSVFYLLAGVLALLYAPTRLIEDANPDWRLVSWALAIEVVGLTLLVAYATGDGRRKIGAGSAEQAEERRKAKSGKQRVNGGRGGTDSTPHPSPAHEPSVSERGCVEDQPQRVRIGESAAADAPTPAHSRAPVQGHNARTCSGKSLPERGGEGEDAESGKRHSEKPTPDPSQEGNVTGEIGNRISAFSFQRFSFSDFVFPICFFLVAVPWPTVVEGPLIQALTQANAAVTVELVNLLGVPALQRGNVIEVATGLVGIDEACSGIRSFQATLMISLFLGELYRLSVVGRFVLCLTGFALSFLFNIGRTSLLVWVASSKGVPAIASWHDPAGIAILVGCFCGLWGVSVVLKRKSESRKQKAKSREQKAESGLRGNRTTGSRTTDDETENKPTPDPSQEGNTNRLAESGNQESGNQSNFSFPRPAKSLVCYFTGQLSTFQSFLMPLALCVWIAFVELGVEWWYRSHEVRLAHATEWTVSWPTNSPTFRELPIAEQSRRILRYDEARNATWRESDGTQWQTVFLRWNPGRTALFLARNHTPEVCLTAAGRKVVSVSDIEWLDVNGLRMPFRDYEISDQGRVFHVFYCLWNDRANEQGFETMGLTYGNRLGPVLAGLRNPGQRSIEIAVSGTEDGTSPLAAVREELGKLVKLKAED